MLGLRTSLYKVDNLEEATEWYSKAFRAEPYFRESFYVGFSIGGYELGLLPTEGPQKRADNAYTYWGVEDIQQEYKHLLDLGATVHEAPNSVGEDLWVASVYDPWGNVLGIIYNPHFKLPG